MSILLVLNKTVSFTFTIDLYMEIAYTIEESLTGNRHEKVLHFHTYDSRFSKNKDGPFSRSEAILLTDSMKEQYKKYFRGLNK